ncbi:hypothetical protein EJ110_NYTH21739 [Nymphaea thermarum]|nr:hypothetical protein EJ110_NYTH21739 [Nymphaea thermarum]
MMTTYSVSTDEQIQSPTSELTIEELMKHHLRIRVGIGPGRVGPRLNKLGLGLARSPWQPKPSPLSYRAGPNYQLYTYRVAVPDGYIHPKRAAAIISGSDGIPSIPVIDFQSLFDGESAAAEREKLHRACKEKGFFQVNLRHHFMHLVSVESSFSRDSDCNLLHEKDDFDGILLHVHLWYTVLVLERFEVVHSQVVGLDSSYKVWTTIKRIYAAQSRENVQQLKYTLQNLKKGNESKTTYFHKAKGVAHQLAMASKPVDDEDLVMNIPSCLPTDEYGTLKVLLCTRVDPINLEELYSLFLIQESEISKFGNLEDPSAYVAHRQNLKNPNYRGRNEQQRGVHEFVLSLKMSVVRLAEIVATLLLNVEPYVKLAGNQDMVH